MKLPEYFDVKYDPTTLKYTCNFAVDRYNKYLLRHVTDELRDISEQNEIRTGLELLQRMWKLAVREDDQVFYIEDDYHLSLYEYRLFCDRSFNLDIFADEGVDCFWMMLSRYYPFKDTEIEQYLKYLNVKELEKNMFINLSDDQLNMIKCYHELNN